jgi:hypothetical protein
VTISRRGRVSWPQAWFAVSIAIAAFTIGAADLAAQRGRPPARPTPAPAPAAPIPQVSAIAIRVVGGGLGANGTELQPFNERPGTSVALSIQAPPGAGIVEIDDHGSKLEAFTDDKGQNLLEEGRIGPFPKVAEDGSVALVEIEVHTRPSTGATSVAAQGTIGMTLANGSKPQRIPNVRLEANRPMKVGAATVTITDAKADEDSTKLTFGLSRQVMYTLRAVHFLDAKGTPIESRRTGSGYINDKAELEFNVTTKEKVVTVEFDVWQNPHTVKVPFSVQAGLGVAPGGKPTSSASDAPAAEARKKAADNRPPPTIGPGEGAATIDAVVKQMQTAAVAGKAADIISVIHPDDRAAFSQAVAMAVTFATLANMNDAKAAEKSQKDVDALFAKHKIKPPLSREPDEIFKDVNQTAFIADALVMLKGQLKKGEDPVSALPVPKGKPQDVKITGDDAVAQIEGRDVKFTKVSGRWFIRLD